MKGLLYQIAFPLICFLIAAPQVEAQQILQIEKRNSLNSRRIYPGETVSYQLNGDKHWYREELVTIYTEEGKIRFENRLVDLSQIHAIRLGSNHRYWTIIGEGLKIFAYQWAFFSLAAAIIGTPLTWSSLLVPATSFSLGVLIKYLNNGKTYHFQKEKYRLRLLDLDFNKPIETP